MGKRGPIGVESALNRAVQRRRTSASPLTQQPAINAPEGLNAECQREWDRVTGILLERGVLDDLDQAALADYIRCWQRLRAAEAEIDANGLVVPGANGARVKNPAATLARNYRAALLAWSKELGLTSASRLRCTIPGPVPKKPNRFDSFRYERTN